MLFLISELTIPFKSNLLILPPETKTMKSNSPKGVATGRQVQEIFEYAKTNNSYRCSQCYQSSSINTVLETAAELNSPVIIQFSNGGAQFNAGKGLKNEKQQAAIAGAVAGLNTSTNLLNFTVQQ